MNKVGKTHTEEMYSDFRRSQSEKVDTSTDEINWRLLLAVILVVLLLLGAGMLVGWLL